MECSICCEKFTKQTRKEIKCPSTECGSSCCLECFKRYIIESDDIIPKCMFCDKNLSYSFIRENVSVSWANKDYLNRRTEHLMSREKSLLPDSQYDVKRELDRRECSKEEVKIYSKIYELQTLVSKLHYQINDIWRNHRLQFPQKQKDNELKITRRRCPIEDCEGFLESDWKCGICKIKCCSHCGESQNDDHVCDEDTKSTFQMIKNDSRPCPQCGIPIYKWQGCNQMYCTQCSCMFDYRTGKLETGFFHNPHYFEAIDNGTIRNHPRQQQNMCGMPDAHEFTRRVKDIRVIMSRSGKPERFLVRLVNLFSFIGHVTALTLVRRWTDREFDNVCKTMRRDYLLKELSEEKWFQSLKEIEKKREKNTEIRQLVTLFRDVARDCINNISEMMNKLWFIADYDYYSYDELPEIQVFDEFVHPCDFIKLQLGEVDRMRDFFNKKMVYMKEKFKQKMPYIDINYEISHCSQFY